MSHALIPGPTTREGEPTGGKPSGLARYVRWLALLVVVAWLAVGGLGGPAVGKLSGVQKNDQASALPRNAESSTAREELSAFAQGSDPGLPFFVVFAREGGLYRADSRVARTFLAGLPDVALTHTDDQARTLRDVLATPPPRALIPSKDGTALFAPVNLNAEFSSGKIGDKVAVGVAAETLRTAVTDQLADSGLTVKVAGPAGFVADIGTAFSGIDALLLLVALGVVFVILLVVYRSPILPFAVLLSAVFGLALAALVIYPLAERGTIEVNGQSQGILSILVIGAATDYALLIVSRYREELHGHARPWDAMQASWRGTVEPIAASALTVILGLLCLLLSDLGSTRSLGPISALGILGALAAALTFLPALLLLIGRQVFWPRVPRVDHVHAEDVLGTRGLWGRVAGAVQRRPRAIWVGTTLALLLAASFATQFQAAGLRQADYFRTSVEYVEGQRLLDAHFPGGTGAPAQMVTEQDQAAAVAEVVKGVDGVVATQIGQAPGTPPAVVDGKVVVQATLADAADSPAAEDTVQRIRDALASDERVVNTPSVGGTTAQLLDTKLASERDNRVVVPAILAVVVLVLIGLLRALVAPVLLALANILSFLATMGISALVFNHLFDFPNADPATPLYGFVFLIALGIDYSIFLMTRVREETPKRGTRGAVIVGLAVTGGVITSAGVVLAATFSALLILPLVFMAQIAFFVAFGVLLDTLVVRSLLLPGLTYDIGSPIWWPSRLTRTGRSPASESAPVPPAAS